MKILEVLSTLSAKGKYFSNMIFFLTGLALFVSYFKFGGIGVATTGSIMLIPLMIAIHVSVKSSSLLSSFNVLQTLGAQASLGIIESIKYLKNFKAEMAEAEIVSKFNLDTIDDAKKVAGMGREFLTELSEFHPASLAFYTAELIALMVISYIMSFFIVIYALFVFL